MEWNDRRPGRGLRPMTGVTRQLHSALWHGTPDERSWQTGARYGIHVGTKEQARTALEARIGRRADDQDWDGTQEYGKTLLGRNRRNVGGMNPDETRYPKPATYHEPVKRPGGGWEHGPGVSWEERDPARHLNSLGATYSSGHPVPMDAKPSVFPVRLVGKMTNTRQTPHEDFKANGLMAGQIKRGRAKNGYYYDNQGEGEGISAVVPTAAHLERLDPKPQFGRTWHDRRGE